MIKRSAQNIVTVHYLLRRLKIEVQILPRGKGQLAGLHIRVDDVVERMVK